MNIDEALEALARDRERHMLTDPCSGADLERLEQALERPLPAGLRALLARFGGGIFYEKHEVFGARRLMVHDIELVPDLLTVRRTMDPRRYPLHALPFHRAAGMLHLLDLRDPEGLVLPGDHSPYPMDLGSFLSRIVLPGADTTAR